MEGEGSEAGSIAKEAGGDTVPKKPEPKPTVPDVELVVDGFGFMPKNMQHQARRRSSVFAKTKPGPEQPQTDDHVDEHSPCASSTNIDIVRRYTWKTKNRMTVQVITYGATITSISVPDRKGVPDDVVNWHSYVSGLKVIMSHVSDRFHEGFPGTIMCQVSFEVTCDNTLKIEMRCTTSEPTVINLSNSPFFNLAGHHSGPALMLDHIFTINADKYTAVDEEGLVTGERKVVGGTAYDFRVPRVLKTMLPKIPMGGYDINYCITRGTDQDLAFQARVLHPLTGRVIEIYSNQPGMQFYTGNLLPDPDKIVEDVAPEETVEDDKSEESEQSSRSSAIGEEEEESEGKKNYGYVPLMGKQGTIYKRHGLFCLMPQNYPDAVNNWIFFPRSDTT
ncbi:hypothetical protein B5X24_HaOG205322 [Helicoverpa armigera]|uniref:Galactose mutarotase n=1 Tax=Helicoverpa armigera TaxID=29058 RepID=A0A2W1BLJ9_HELAM|nr:hypothetical protein B5X24_HaOG205322 [Helicoverpa armigera]